MSCEACGNSRPETRDEKARVADLDLVLCSWGRTVSPRCPLRASWWPPTHRYGLCAWHAAVDRDPRINVFEEFSAFCRKLEGPDEFGVLEADATSVLVSPRYCSTFTHAAPGELWDWISGQRATPPAERACRNPSCPLAKDIVTDAQVEAFREQVRLGGWETALRALTRRTE
jgi:hypothetical protein